jgi:hypothetical protein
MVRTTRKQRIALLRKYAHGGLDEKGISYRDFRKSVQPTFGMDNAIVVQWCGMWLAIERDGYCHS